jgi:hypothetical protein
LSTTAARVTTHRALAALRLTLVKRNV